MSFTLIACGKCGIEFQVPTHFNDERRKNGGDWYCPNGHCRVYRESDVDKLRRRAERAEQRIAQRNDRIDALENSLRAQKGHTTRLKKRAAAGVCPCCNRSFQNLMRHMKGQHPDFAKPEKEKAA